MAIGGIGGYIKQDSGNFQFSQLMNQVNGSAAPKTGKQLKNSLFQGNGAGNGTSGSSVFLTLANASGQTVKKTGIGMNSTLSGKKESGYNHSSYTSQIKQAKSPQNIRMIAAEIRAQITDLKAKLATGEYDEEEIMSAIAHAEALATAAEGRADNLEKERLAEKRLERKELEEKLYGEEEDDGSILMASDEDALTGEAKRRMEKELEEEQRKLLEEMQKEMAKELSEEMEELTEETQEEDDPLQALDEMAEILKGSMSREDIEEMKKKHRAAEDMEITRADMDYLKAKFQRLQQQKDAIKSGAAVFSLGGEQMNAKELKQSIKALSTTAKQAGSKAKAPLAASSGMSSPAASFRTPASFDGASVSVGGSVDISG